MKRRVQEISLKPHTKKAITLGAASFFAVVGLAFQSDYVLADELAHAEGVEEEHTSTKLNEDSEKTIISSITSADNVDTETNNEDELPQDGNNQIQEDESSSKVSNRQELTTSDKSTEETNRDSETSSKKTEQSSSQLKVSFTDHNVIPDGFKFYVYNKKTKLGNNYVVHNGQIDTPDISPGESLTMRVGDYWHYSFSIAGGKYISDTINIKKEDNALVAYDELTNEPIQPIESLTVTKNTDLIGKKPAEEVNKTTHTLKLIDLATGNPIKVLNEEEEPLFKLQGGGEVKAIQSKNGQLELTLNNNVDYCLQLIKTADSIYKMNGLKISSQDGKLITAGQHEVSQLELAKSSYSSYAYVIEGKEFLADYYVLKPLEFRLEEVGNPSNTQIVTSEIIQTPTVLNGKDIIVDGVVLKYNLQLGRQYKLTLNQNDNEFYLEKPIYFTYAHQKDGGYLPIAPAGYPTPEQAAGEFQAIYLTRGDGSLEAQPIENQGQAADNNCPICNGETSPMTEVKLTTKPMHLKAQDGKALDFSAIKFKLFNSSKQEVEAIIKPNSDGVLPSLELFENNSYYLQLISEKYQMHNVYLEADSTSAEEQNFPYNFKTAAPQKELLLTNKLTPGNHDGKFEATLQLVYNHKPAAQKTIRLTSAFETLEATSDQDGKLHLRLIEDATYVLSSVDHNYIIDTVPLVLKDKTEWGKAGTKLLFDHTWCGQLETIELKDRILGKAEGRITCEPGNTTISGMNFKNLKLEVAALDQSNVSELKGKDALFLDLVLFNTQRRHLERTKLAAGQYNIVRKLPEGKKVSAVYYLNQGEKQNFKFKQDGSFVEIQNVDSIGLYPLVIEFEDHSVTLPGETTPGQENENLPSPNTPSQPESDENSNQEESNIENESGEDDPSSPTNSSNAGGQEQQRPATENSHHDSETSDLQSGTSSSERPNMPLEEEPGHHGSEQTQEGDNDGRGLGSGASGASENTNTNDRPAKTERPNKTSEDKPQKQTPAAGQSSDLTDQQGKNNKQEARKQKGQELTHLPQTGTSIAYSWECLGLALAAVGSAFMIKRKS